MSVVGQFDELPRTARSQRAPFVRLNVGHPSIPYLKAYWPMQVIDTGRVRDLTLTNANGSLFGNCASTVDELGVCLKLPGSTGDYVDIGSIAALDFAGEFSVGIWFKTTQTTDGRILQSYAGGNPVIALSQNPGGVAGKLNFFVRDSVGTTASFDSLSDTNDDRWHLAIITFSLGGFLVSGYVDGQVQGSSGLGSAAGMGSGQYYWALGRAGNVEAAVYFNGLVQNAFAMNRCLSAGDCLSMWLDRNQLLEPPRRLRVGVASVAPPSGDAYGFGQFITVTP